MMRPLQLVACFALTAASLLALAQEAHDQTDDQMKQMKMAPIPLAETPSNNPATSTPAITGNPNNGRPLTYTCQGCHGIPGYKNAYPNYHVPRIGGQSSQYLINALTAYRTGTRKHPTMQAQSQSFSDQDIADIAAYLSGLK